MAAIKIPISGDALVSIDRLDRMIGELERRLPTLETRDERHACLNTVKDLQRRFNEECHAAALAQHSAAPITDTREAGRYAIVRNADGTIKAVVWGAPNIG